MGSRVGERVGAGHEMRGLESPSVINFLLN